MTRMNSVKAIPFLLALSLCCMSISSCNKDSNIKNGPGKQGKITGEEISRGTCIAFDTTSDTAILHYEKESGTYYLDYFYKGEGSFAFTWDKSSNLLTIIEFATGLTSGFYPIDFLSQKEYEAEMGASAELSYYNPVEDIFTFNVLYQTAIDDGVIVRYPATITYKPKKEDS